MALTEKQKQNVLALDNSRKLAIATAPTARTKRWRNGEIGFQDLAKRLATPTRTQETLAEYFAMTTEQQGLIKDVGGFVGGTLANGRRMAANVRWRSMITLDIDNGDSTILEAVYRGLGTAFNYLVYSTHKHRPEAPRLRVVIPLRDNIPVDQYEPIARRLAADIGIEAMDRTTYQPSRVMYWGSVAKDGEFVFEANSGDYLDPAEVLARYEDWTDVYLWPYAEEEMANVKKLVDKQGDPLEKKGFIGAFNRAYRIEDVIETWLSDQYEPFKEDRWTYANGSTAGGLVIYEDGLFAYSHHGTSPTSGQLTNAFDFLRLHLYGELDQDIDPETSATKRPSYKEVMNLIRKDTATNAELTSLQDLPFEVFDDPRQDASKQKADKSQKTASADFTADEFDEFLSFEEDDDFDPSDLTSADQVRAWLAQLTRDDRGVIESTGANVKVILMNDPNLKDKVAIDEFSQRLTVRGELPWPRLGDDWTDTDDGSLQIYLEQYYEIVGERKIINALNEVAIERAFHPVKEYIESCQWDGAPRIEQVFQQFFGADDTEYTRTVALIHFVASIARVYRPGIKYDTAVVFVGAQGIGKSYFIAKLGGEWASDSLQRVDNKDAYESLIGSWLIELPEMSAMKKADNETMKHFLSKKEDRFRMAFGRRTQTYRRSCTFWGSSNDLSFLKDMTGNRRYFPVGCDRDQQRLRSWEHLTDSLVAQLWGEAKALFDDGYSIYLPDELYPVAEMIQAEYTEESPILSIIRDYLDFPFTQDDHKLSPNERYLMTKHANDDEIAQRKAEGGKRTDVTCIVQLWVEALGHERTALTRFDSREISSVITQLNWKRTNKNRRFNYHGVQKAFARADRRKKS